MRPLLLLLVALVALPGCVTTQDAPPPTAQTTAPGGDCLGALHGVDLQRATIDEIEAALANGTFTSVDLVDAYVARIRAFDNQTNAVQLVNPKAREQAVALDAERAAGHVRGPLHGIPILIKDNVGTDDMPTTAGSIALATNVPKRNATLTDKLVAQGAIILGKTHLSEFAQWISLSNPNGYSSLGGQVVNAYTGGDPSGSSSGSGVAGSMAYAAATIGTETQGSILGPSDANSLVGVKPTTGLVSRAGVIPLAASFDTPGPMARSVRDAARLLDAIAGPDSKDAATAQAGSHVPPGGYAASLRADALKGKRLGYDPDFSGATFARAKEDLAKLGATLVPVQVKSGTDSVGGSELGLIPNEFKAGINAYLANEAGPGLPVKTLDDIITYNQAHPDKVKYGQDLLIASDATAGDATAAQAAAIPVVAADRAFVDGLFARDNLDALVGPSLAYYQSGAAAGYPTVIVPAGYNGKSPEGLSFFGPAWSEEKLLSYAYSYEQATMRRVPPTAINATLLAGACQG